LRRLLYCASDAQEDDRQHGGHAAVHAVSFVSRADFTSQAIAVLMALCVVKFTEAQVSAANTAAQFGTVHLGFCNRERKSRTGRALFAELIAGRNRSTKSVGSRLRYEN
jgi:hypothetical protein